MGEPILWRLLTLQGKWLRSKQTHSRRVQTFAMSFYVIKTMVPSELQKEPWFYCISSCFLLIFLLSFLSDEERLLLVW